MPRHEHEQQKHDRRERKPDGDPNGDLPPPFKPLPLFHDFSFLKREVVDVLVLLRTAVLPLEGAVLREVAELVPDDLRVGCFVAEKWFWLSLLQLWHTGGTGGVCGVRRW